MISPPSLADVIMDAYERLWFRQEKALTFGLADASTDAWEQLWFG